MKKVILIVIDGMRPDAFEKCLAENGKASQ